MISQLTRSGRLTTLSHQTDIDTLVPGVGAPCSSQTNNAVRENNIGRWKLTFLSALCCCCCPQPATRNRKPITLYIAPVRSGSLCVCVYVGNTNLKHWNNNTGLNSHQRHVTVIPRLSGVSQSVWGCARNDSTKHAHNEMIIENYAKQQQQ